MENVLLVVHLILALALIGVVLLQRSEGSALLSGGGAMSGRPPATPLGKVTWALAAAFIATSIALTITAAQDSAGSSVVDRLGIETPAAEEPAAVPGIDSLLPPVPAGNSGAAPAEPPRAD